MDFSIPPELPLVLQNQLNELIKDYKEENLTSKGYETKRKQLLDKYRNNEQKLLLSKHSNLSLNINRREPDLYGSLRISNSSTSSADASNLQDSLKYNRSSIDSTREDYKVGSVRQNQIYRVTTTNSNSTLFSPRKHKQSSSLQLSLNSYESGLESYTPMTPLLPRLESLLESTFLPLILRGRYNHYEKETAIISINEKNKESSITWGKLYLRAEKVAHELKKSQLKKMDKVLLWYNKDEVIDFTVALLGCFIADMIAVPVSFQTYSLVEIIQIIKLTNSQFSLISSECHKQLDNLQTTNNNTKIKLIKSGFISQVTFLKTTDLGTYNKAKKMTPTYDVSQISYIEFTRTPLGRLSGIVMKPRVINDQLTMLSKIIDSRAMPHWKKGEINRSYKTRTAEKGFTILNTLDPTRSTGLICGVLFNIFSGNLLISIDNSLTTKPGSYEELIYRFSADILLNEQLQLKQVVIGYLEDPKVINSRKQKINLSCIKCCLTCCTTIDTEVSDMVVHKWLKNLGCYDANICYSPMLTLPDIGGIFISLKDQLGMLDNFPIHNTKLRLQDDVFINKEKLKGNIVESSITAMINSSSSFTEYLRLTTFGFPIPNATVCVVNLDDCTLVPDLTVGEIWISSKSLTDEFYQMDRVNEFVFHARINFQKMFSFVKGNTLEAAQSKEKINTIMSIVPPSTQFLRTKLMGFVHNGKIYVLSMIEDMFLQNMLVQLPNWSHTSDITRAKKPIPSPNKSVNNFVEKNDNELTLEKGPKRIVQTYYLQQITESIVRTVSTVSDVAAFELNHNSDEHFLVIIVESSLSRSTLFQEDNLLVQSKEKLKKREQKMNELTEQIYRILWIFHKIQPLCVLVVSPNTLPRRYCSLELANSTIESKFQSGELVANFVKFQFDNVILDFIPHSLYYNESIFSEHLSNLRHLALEQERGSDGENQRMILQTSGVDYRDIVYDHRTNKNLGIFKNLLDILEWRIEAFPNESAFNDGTFKGSSKENENNIHKNISWGTFHNIIASYLRKILTSKMPLNKGDRVVVMCENSIEYTAIIIACFYCNLVVLPIDIINEDTAAEDISYLTNIISSFSVKRLFVDGNTNFLLESNTTISRLWKKEKAVIPKVTNISKVKIKTDVSIKMFKTYAIQKRQKLNSNTSTCLIWVNRDNSPIKNTHPTMTASSLLNSCKILKETLEITNDDTLFSLCNYTHGLGFIIGNLLGIYAGCYTNYFTMDDIFVNPNNLLFGLQNMNVKNLFLTPSLFYAMISKASNVIDSEKTLKVNVPSKKNPATATIKPDFLRNVKNIMIPFTGRPKTTTIENILKKNGNVQVSIEQISYIYQNQFNFNISMRSYMGIPPVDIYLDRSALREGLIKELNGSDRMKSGLRIQDSGVVPVCTDVVIVNPETKKPCHEGEYGEIWCCSEANVSDYFISRDANDKSSKVKLTRDTFVTEQFKSKMDESNDNGLTYLRTGDLGFIKPLKCLNNDGEEISFNLLYVLGSIGDIIDILGLTHFVGDLESTVKETNPNIVNCIIAKCGGLLVCLVKCKETTKQIYANLTVLITSQLLSEHGVILDLCSFVGKNNIAKDIPENWSLHRTQVIEAWFAQTLNIESQFGINYGENISLYLLSDLERS
ncbi:hypothetical protein TPHA_0F01590 [Tetrapisispora phaffii CBS 4417]|uniref:DMAP1-binding domain-containing protein n=1 Tax=Tetrapisispora phaffii (strain ATCC 24235 / CBS 4417 / NBRC 1672 / NRRL Y-8282 / UCD 70-5) TaxID=1071381 RepID=G8BV61_TETPH|nr:hypothetical protein TPHA_0F01590 [Tetrapisispora phaffii CBS 4417]CCE63643.1 hypothetical protein TPHA_0F01590 [Tetrapisispora phaffii CBS 4417]